MNSGLFHELVAYSLILYVLRHLQILKKPKSSERDNNTSFQNLHNLKITSNFVELSYKTKQNT